MTLPVEKKIIIIASLHAYLSKYSEQTIHGGLPARIQSAVQSLMDEVVCGLEHRSLNDLLEEFRTFAPKDQIEMFDTLLTENRIASIKGIRDKAISASQPLDLSMYYKGYKKIPLHTFSWQSKIDEFKRVVEAFADPETDFTSFCRSSLEFFGRISERSVPVMMPKPNDAIIPELIDRNLVSGMDAADLVDDLNRIQRLTARISKDNREKIHSGGLAAESFVKMGHDAFMFLQAYWNSTHLKNKIDICRYIVLWSGPGKAGLLKQLVAKAPGDKHFELCMACTGVHAGKSLREFNLGAELESKTERSDFEKFEKLIQNHRFIYDFLFIVNFHGSLEILQSDRWKSIFEKLKAAKKDCSTPPKRPFDKNTCLAQMPMENATATIVPEDQVVVSKPGPDALSDSQDDMSFVLYDDDMDFDDLSADDKKRSAEDKIAEENSTWNQYLKPFLSENLLGILGAALLMLAWLCISIWVWNKGQYYRILAGALPMYLTSFSLAFISRFFHKNLDKGVSARAPGLFAAICILSIPFNYLIGLSMFYLGKTVGPVAGSVLGVVYGLTLIFIIGKWIKESIGFNPGLYLAVINTILFLPAFSLFFNRPMLSVSIHIILFATFFFTGYQIHTTKMIQASKYRFRYLLFGSNYILTIFICCVYYRTIPDPGSIAVLAQLISLFIVYLSKSEFIFKQMILTAVLSVLGILMSFKSALPVTPLCIAGSGMAWLTYKKRMPLPWLDDIMVGHILMLSAAIVFEIKSHFFDFHFLLIPGIAFCALLALVFSVFYEKRYAKRTMRTVSYFSPAVTVCILLAVLQAPLNTLPGFFIAMILSFATCGHSYRRYATGYLKPLWFTNLGIGLSVPALGLAAIWRPAAALLSFAIMGAVWTFAGTRLKDALAHSFKTTVALVINVVATVTFISGGLVFYFNPSEIDLLLILAFIALILSLFSTAKKTMSQVPIYMAFLVAGIFGAIIYKFAGIRMLTGLGTGLAALGALYASHLLKKHRLWQADHFDTVFNREMPLRGKAWLVFPFELAGWAMTLTALAKVTYHFSLLNCSPHHFSFTAFKIIAALIIVFSCLFYFIKKYNIPNSGYLLFWPSLLIFCSLSSYVPAIFMPLWLLIFVFIYDYYASADKIPPNFKQSIQLPVKYVNLILNYLCILFGFFLYAYYIVLLSPSPWNKHLLAAAVAMACIYIHKIFVLKISKYFAHLILFHIVALLILGFALFHQETIAQALQHNFQTFLRLVGADLLKLLTGISFILFIPGFALEKHENKMARCYCEVFHIWLFGAACIISIVLPALLAYHLVDPFKPEFLSILIYITLAGLGLVHAGSRFFHSVFLYGAKAVLCVCTGILLSGRPFLGLIFGFVAFTILEILLYQGVKHKITRPLEARPAKINYPSRLAKACEIFVYFTLVVHLFFFTMFSNPPNHFLLYLLIPYVVFCYRRTGKNYLGYLAVGIFTYANALISLKFLPFFIKNQLNILHLLSVCAIFTIAVFLVYNKLSRLYRKEAAA